MTRLQIAIFALLTLACAQLKAQPRPNKNDAIDEMAGLLANSLYPKVPLEQEAAEIRKEEIPFLVDFVNAVDNCRPLGKGRVEKFTLLVHKYRLKNQLSLYFRKGKFKPADAGLLVAQTRKIITKQKVVIDSYCKNLESEIRRLQKQQDARSKGLIPHYQGQLRVNIVVIRDMAAYLKTF